MINKTIFLFWLKNCLPDQTKLLTLFIGAYILISYSLKKNKLAFVFFIYLFTLSSPLAADQASNYLVIDTLVRSCYKDIKSCDLSLVKIHDFQKNAALNKKFSCQTRLLGLEANLIMATNFNLKRKEAKSLLNAIKKYC